MVQVPQPTAESIGSLIYRKFKLPLHHSRLTDPEALVEFWSLARGAADTVGVTLSEPDWAEPARARRVVFYDTDEFDLYGNCFILRKRTSLRRNHSARVEVALKFRHADRRSVANMDLRPAAEIPHTIRFKEQILPPPDNELGMGSIFSRACKIIEPCDLEGVPYRTLAEVFPALRRPEVDPDATLKVVRGAIVSETISEIGRLDLGDGIAAKALISLWRLEREREGLTGEFSFQIKYDAAKVRSERIRELSESFYLALQLRLAGWGKAGATKVHEVYRLETHC
jgi:hypothetical protein